MTRAGWFWRSIALCRSDFRNRCFRSGTESYLSLNCWVCVNRRGAVCRASAGGEILRPVQRRRWMTASGLIHRILVCSFTCATNGRRSFPKNLDSDLQSCSRPRRPRTIDNYLGESPAIPIALESPQLLNAFPKLAKELISPQSLFTIWRYLAAVGFPVCGCFATSCAISRYIFASASFSLAISEY